MTSLLGMWLKAMNWRTGRGACNRCRTRRTRPTRLVPRLEALEDRTLLSTYTVNSLTDTGTGSGLTGDLRYCITNATSGNDTIDFAPGLSGTIQLQSALPTLNASVAIQGPGADLLAVKGGFAYSLYSYFSIFTVGSAATAQISGLTLADAYHAIDNEGSVVVNTSILSQNGAPAIYNAGSLTVSNSTLSANYDAIYNIGSVTVSNSTFSANNGGAIDNEGSAIVTDSTFSGNSVDNSTDHTDGLGGAISNSGNLTINNSILSGNKAIGGWPTGTGTWGGYYTVSPAYNGMGGGIYMAGGTLSINSSTLADNQAIGGSTVGSGSSAGNGYGGGLYIAGGTVSINNSTLADNQAVGGTSNWSPGLGDGGGIYNAAGSSALQVHDVILANNTADTAADLDGSLTSQGYNLIGTTNGGSGFASSDLLNVNPQLGPLQDNGGPTQTMALLDGSPAIDAGDNTDAPAYDQRGPGFARIVNGTIDIGAFEVQSGSSSQASSLAVAGFPSVSTAGAAGTVTVTAKNTDGYTANSYTGTVQFSSSDPSAMIRDPITGNIVALAGFTYQFTTADYGSHSFVVELNTVGYQSISATDTQNSTLTGSQTDIQVVPLATITGPSEGALNQMLTYTLGASGDPAGTNYTFSINWADGSAVQTITGPSGTTVSHSYTTSGWQSIGVTATDPNGFTSNPANQWVYPKLRTSEDPPSIFLAFRTGRRRFPRVLA
jgi:hypothetical protein